MVHDSLDTNLPDITIATSIAPLADLPNQQKAIASWLALGFKVISVNAPDEIELVKAYFPNVEFLPASRDGRNKYGKPYVYFDDILQCLKGRDSRICGIVNSDIHLLHAGLYSFVQQEAQDAFIYGARMDIASLEAHTQGKWYNGFDYFFFDRKVIDYYPPEEFYIGLPWWDYWAVLMPLMKNVIVKKLTTPVAYHVIHTPGNLQAGSWIPLGLVIGKYARPPFPLTEETMARYQPMLFQVLSKKGTEISIPATNVPISAVVHTLNEEENIRNCLECLRWADEIIVVDMYSEDKTLEIARQYTDKIFMHERCRYVEPARRFALSQTSHEWVLVVDADELVPPCLRDILLELAKGDTCDVVLIPRANYLFGHLMKGSGRGADEDSQLRFFKKGYIQYTDQIHAHPLLRPDTRVQRLAGEQQSFIHFNYINVEHYLEKLDRYTTIEAENDYLAGKPFNLEDAWQKSFSKINDIAFARGGLEKDGAIGFGLGVLMAMYHFTAALKLKVIEDYGDLNPAKHIKQKYQNIADEIIAEYQEQCPEPR